MTGNFAIFLLGRPAQVGRHHSLWAHTGDSVKAAKLRAVVASAQVTYPVIPGSIRRKMMDAALGD